MGNKVTKAHLKTKTRKTMYTLQPIPTELYTFVSPGYSCCHGDSPPFYLFQIAQALALWFLVVLLVCCPVLGVSFALEFLELWCNLECILNYKILGIKKPLLIYLLFLLRLPICCFLLGAFFYAFYFFVCIYGMHECAYGYPCTCVYMPVKAQS